jgi:hypothetical protein
MAVLCAGLHLRAAEGAEGPAPKAGRGLTAGVSSVCITPQRPIWMAGFGARTKPSEGKYQDLFVKALALQDSSGQRAVILTSDLVGVTRNWREPVLRQAKERFGLEPAQVLFNASHTHCGPEFRPVTDNVYFSRSDPEYAADLVKRTVAAIQQALDDLEEAQLWRARGSCTMGVNRRRPLAGDPKRVDPSLLPNPQGLTDPDVPVLKVLRKDGKVKAVLFLYACHPTTMGGYLLGGDYPGFAQRYVEKEFPGATALFLQGCGGDIKPRNVSGTGRFKDGPLEVVDGFGRELAQAVITALAGKLVRVQGSLAARQGSVDLPAQPLPARAELEARATGKDYRAEWARQTLASLKAGKDLRTSLAEIVQVIDIGDDFTLVGLSGEVCVEYALRLKRELGRDLWVAGYSNDVSAYIPSARMVPEGGYEVERSLLGSSQPAPFQPGIEERIVAKVHELARAGRGARP